MDSRPPGLPGETLQDTLNHSHQHPGPTFSFQVVSGPTGPHPGPGSFTIALVIPSILRDRLLESSSRCKHLPVPCNSLRGKRGERRGRRRGSRRGGGYFPPPFRPSLSRWQLSTFLYKVPDFMTGARPLRAPVSGHRVKARRGLPTAFSTPWSLASRQRRSPNPSDPKVRICCFQWVFFFCFS